MTKEELRAALKAGKRMDELFHYAQGEECLIFKADEFAVGEEILYIPDTDLNEIPMDEAVTDEETIDDILSCCYAGDDFVELCRAFHCPESYAEPLFLLCNWQHPSSVLAEGWPDDGEVSEG